MGLGEIALAHGHQSHEDKHHTDAFVITELAPYREALFVTNARCRVVPTDVRRKPEQVMRPRN